MRLTKASPVHTNQFKAIIFDMDGVIVDSEPLHEQSFLEVWDNMGYRDNHSINFSEFYGRSDRVVWEEFIKKHNPNKTIDELMVLREKRLIELIRDKKPIFRGVLNLIQELASTYPLGLASGSIHRIIDEVLNMQDLRKYFNCITSSEDVAMPKPSPEIFLLTAKRLNIEAKDCCVIEDTVNGIRAGKLAGMNVIAITNTFSSEELIKAGADSICENYLEISNKISIIK